LKVNPALPSKSEAISKVSVGGSNKKSAIRIGRMKPQPEFRQVIRAIAIKLTMEGTDSQKVSDDLGRSQATIQTWINRFRTGGICKRDRKDLDELEEKITERIKPYWEDAKRLTRLIGNGYLLSELNAIRKNELRPYN
jgi:hypothetical protein